jgi:hypothetical protein
LLTRIRRTIRDAARRVQANRARKRQAANRR